MLPLSSLIKKSIQLIRKEGVSAFSTRTKDYLSRYFSLKSYLSYQKLLKKKERLHRRWYHQQGRKVSIVIPSYNDTSYLKKCIQSLEQSLKPNPGNSVGQSIQILIVDDASTQPEHQSFLKSLSSSHTQTNFKIQVLYKTKNEGFARAVNFGLNHCEDRDVVILNSDIEAHPGWLEALQYAAYQKETIGIVGPKLLYPDGSIQSAGSHRNNEAPEWFDHCYRHKPGFYGPTNLPRPMLGMTGACLYIKRSVLKKTGFFDENYPMAFEDMDFCLRARQSGFEILYYPFSILTHHESVSRGKQLGPREKESMNYFWKKWKPVFNQRTIRSNEGKIRLIFVLQTTEIAGGHRILFEHANRLLDQGFDVQIFATDNPPDWFTLKTPFKKFSSFEELTEALKDEPAIKIATWWKTAEPVWLASLERGIPVYFVQDIETSYYAQDQLMRDRVLASYRKEFRYLTTSQWNAEELKKLDLEATVVPCGIDLEVFKPIQGSTHKTRSKNTLLTAGRANPLKNLALTLSAWKDLKSPRPTLWMYGTEPELAKGLDNCQYFCKPTDKEINTLLNQTTAFILTSKHEGFALTILEAMAAGAPVICTDADGNRDFCVPEKNCLWVEQGNTAQLTQAIHRLLSDERLQEKLRHEGYLTAQRYGWPPIMTKVVDFIEEISDK